MATIDPATISLAGSPSPLTVRAGSGAVEVTAAAANSPSCRALLERFGDAVAAVKLLSERVFPGPVSISYAVDPEDAGHEFFVFDVEASGEYAQYRERVFAWHDGRENPQPARRRRSPGRHQWHRRHHPG